MKHVATLIPTLDRIGGAEQQVIAIAKGLANRGWRASVVALSGRGGEVLGELRSFGVEFVSLGMRKGLADPRGWIRLRQWLRNEAPDVVHAHLPHAAWLARWSRVALPVRVLVDTIHSSSTGTVSRRIGYRVSNWIPDKITAVSQASADSWIASEMVDGDDVMVLPNGIDTDHWKPNSAIRAERRQDLAIEDRFLWIAVGRLEPVKDYPLLLQAMVGLPPNAALAIAGAGSLENVLRQQATKLGLCERVHFLGFESRVLPWLLAADGFVLCSKWEGLPLALLESCACALPVVATDVPGTREVLADSHGSIFVLPGNVESLRAGMMQVMQMSQPERTQTGMRLRQSVVERFSMDSVLDRWEVLYAELLEKNPQPIRARRTYVVTNTGSTRLAPADSHQAKSTPQFHSHH